jgi:hypothetical protein
MASDTKKAGGADRKTDTNGACFTLKVTEYFIYQSSEADWFRRARDSKCADALETRPPSRVSVTLLLTLIFKQNQPKSVRCRRGPSEFRPLAKLTSENSYTELICPML